MPGDGGARRRAILFGAALLAGCGALDPAEVGPLGADEGALGEEEEGPLAEDGVEDALEDADDLVDGEVEEVEPLVD